MARYRLTVEYDGAPFSGWQRQENAPSVQATIEDAIFAYCGRQTTVHSAGRTDAGVHARAMTAHVDLEHDPDPRVVQSAVNQHMRPAPVAILDAKIAAPDFHARFSALGRRYEYRIANRRAPLTLDAGRVWRVVPPLDADAMHLAAQALVGRHDFSTFRAAHCQADSPVRTLDVLKVRRDSDYVLIEAAARSFLHHQVRSMVGALAQVGLGRWRIEDVAAALVARDRTACGPVAPAEGLYFVEATY